jgi:hypothetical protein
MKLGIEEMHLNIIKVIYDKSIANIMLNGEKTEIVSSKVRNETRVSTLIQCSSGISSQSNKIGEEIKGIQIGKGVIKLSIFADDMTLYLKDLKNFTKKPPRHHKHLQQSSIIQNQYIKLLAFLYTKNEQDEKEIRKTIPFTIASKDIKYLGIKLTKE